MLLCLFSYLIIQIKTAKLLNNLWKFYSILVFFSQPPFFLIGLACIPSTHHHHHSNKLPVNSIKLKIRLLTLIGIFYIIIIFAGGACCLLAWRLLARCLQMPTNAPLIALISSQARHRRIFFSASRSAD